MRAKQVWDVVPLPSKFKLLRNRLLFSKLTTAYFIFSVIHCIIQISLQIRAFTINADAAAFLYDLSVQGNATDNRVPVLEHDTLSLCPDVPISLTNRSTCQIVWGDKSKDDSGSSLSSITSSILSTPAITSLTSTVATSTTSLVVVPTPSPTGNLAAGGPLPIVPESGPATVTVFVDSDGQTIGNAEIGAALVSAGLPGLDDTLLKRKVNILVSGDTSLTISGDGFQNVEVSKDCLWALNWPVSILDNTKREDIVFIAFQFWVLGMSIVALLNESIPHIFASLFTHVLAAAWGAFQINHTANFRTNFNKAITNGVCGVSLLPHYWEQRARIEFPSLGLNAAALILSAWFTWKLVKLFGWQTFKRVGASLTINRIYKLVLVLSITLQLSLFFMTAAVSLWIDNLFNGIAATTSWYVALYKAAAFVTALLLVPWLMTGWFAVRKEMRIPMFVFLVLSILYLAGWGVMLLADTCRRTFMTWTFFGIMTSASIFLTLVSLVLGIVCRYNFGKGLPRYLNAQEPLPGDDFQPVYGASSDIEKVAFPSNEKPIPTYSAAFGKGSEVPPPSQMFPSRMGPRFFNQSAEPFETPRSISPVSIPAPALTRVQSNEPSPNGYAYESGMTRNDTQKSFGSIASYYSYSSSDNTHSRNNSQSQTINGRRWVIE